MKIFGHNLLLLSISLLSLQIIAQNKIKEVELAANKNCRQTDSLVLLTLHTATGGDNWSNKWNLSTPLNTWYGIGLNNDGCIDSIILKSNNLSGEIPSELGNLSNLEVLNLGENELNGMIPKTLGNLTKLKQINLFANKLVGSIPKEIVNLKELTNLYLSFNFLEGSIPVEISHLANLKRVDLRVNRIAGNLPAEIGNLSNLEFLSLSYNNLRGCYYTELKPLCEQLDNISLIDIGNNFDASWNNFCQNNAGICGDCGFNNNCKCNIDDVTALRALYNATGGDDWSNNNGWSVLENQNLDSGCDLGKLHGVTLNNNGRVAILDFRFNRLTGKLPAEIGLLCDLRSLILSVNRLSDPLPLEIYNLDNLVILNLSFNRFSGNVPVELSNLSKLESLSLSGNQFSGTIPPELGNLTKLVGLAFEKNQLTGVIPDLSNLINLKFLKLPYNNLTGSLPATLSKLNKLIYFEVQSNQLSGCYNEDLLNLCDQLDPKDRDFYINDGNDFDGLWSKFCHCNTGSCSTDFDLEINSNVIFQNQYQTEGNINTVGEVCINNGQNVAYIATVTTLNIGFEAKAGSEVLIIPKKCK